jgi:hypothetical protein
MKRNKNLASFLMVIPLLFIFDGKAENLVSARLDVEKSNHLIKEKIVYELICSEFTREINKYKTDKAKKEFEAHHVYFREWPHQFKKLIDPTFYPLYKNIIDEKLKADKIHNLSTDFNSWAPPSLAALPCSSDIEHWIELKNEWKNLKPSLPENFFRNKGYFKIFIQDFPDKIEKVFYSTLFYLLLFYAVFANGQLINNFIIKRKLQGAWTFVLTPVLSIFLEKHLKIPSLIHFNNYERILLTSFVLFLVTLASILIIKKLERYFKNNNSFDKLFIQEIPESIDIFQAINIGDKNRARELIDGNLKLIESTNSDGWTPLHVIAAQGVDTRPVHVEIAELLLQSGADPDSKSPLGWTPLHLIAINGADESMPILEILIDYNANPFLTANDGITNWWILWQHGEAVKNAIENYEKKVGHGR